MAIIPTHGNTQGVINHLIPLQLDNLPLPRLNITVSQESHLTLPPGDWSAVGSLTLAPDSAIAMGGRAIENNSLYNIIFILGSSVTLD